MTKEKHKVWLNGTAVIELFVQAIKLATIKRYTFTASDGDQFRKH